MLLALSRALQPEADRLAELAAAARWQVCYPQPAEWRELNAAAGLAFYGDHESAIAFAGGAYQLLRPRDGAHAELSMGLLHRWVSIEPPGQLAKYPGPIFVKNCDELHKSFGPRVFASGREARAVIADVIRAGQEISEIIVAEPVRWNVEYRLLVHAGSVIASSPYRRHGQREPNWPDSPAESNAARELANRVIADYGQRLPAAFVCDVGLIEGKGWAVVELNPIWCARFFGCSLAGILLALAAVCVRKSATGALPDLVGLTP